MNNNWSSKRVILMAATILVLVGLVIYPLIFHGEVQIGVNPAQPLPEEPEQIEEKPISLKISAVGDIMVHKPQIPAQYDPQTDSYSFENNFQYIKQYIEAADLALCNVETTFAGGNYSGYPLFNAPESLAQDIKKAGFDGALTANNHIMDKGIKGMKRTLEILRTEGLHTAGTQLEGEPTYTIIDVKGVKIGLVAYFYETSMVNGRTTINGNYVSDEDLSLLNTFNYTTLEDDLPRIEQSIKDAKANGAELVVCYFHWGEEYQRSPNDYQLHMARKAVEFGADILFASHPHVLQGMEFLTNEQTGNQVPVFYSMGNFISNQRAETLDNRYTEQGMIAEVELEYMKSTKEILSIKMGAVPTWVDKYTRKGKDIYTIIPLDNDMSTNPDLKASGHLSRATQALGDIKTLLGEEFIY